MKAISLDQISLLEDQTASDIDSSPLHTYDIEATQITLNTSQKKQLTQTNPLKGDLVTDFDTEYTFINAHGARKNLF